jgi:molybdopterin-guanine dinucleotide biosynthesis protein B
MAQVLCIIGWSNSGKTTLIEALLKVLREEGKRVVVIKHHHHSQALPEGKDTTRFLLAGAKRAILLGPGGYQVFSEEGDERLLEEVIRSQEGVDLILVEGFKNSKYPKIEVYNGSPEGPLYRQVKGVLAVVSDLVEDPQIVCFKTGEVEGLLRFIKERFLGPQQELELWVDGVKLKLNRFVKDLYHRLIGVLVQSLKGGERGKEALIKWKRE